MACRMDEVRPQPAGARAQAYTPPRHRNLAADYSRNLSSRPRLGESVVIIYLAVSGLRVEEPDPVRAAPWPDTLKSCVLSAESMQAPNGSTNWTKI